MSHHGIRLCSEFDPSLTYYLAGPMTGYTNFNYDAFQRTMEALESSGAQVRSPHKVEWPDETLEGDDLWRYMMRATMRLLLDCDGIILMKGWPSSRGSMVEFNIASALKYPSYFVDGGFLVPMHMSSISD